MPRPLVLYGIKRVLRALWSLEYGLRRLFRPPDHLLAGSCNACGACCEEPTLQVGWITWHLPTVRGLFLAWHGRVNGFHLVRRERASRTFHFRCAHFDPATRRCDAYSSRPFPCADYPRILLHQPWPDFFPTCGYRPVSRDGGSMARALEQADLTPEQRASLVVPHPPPAPWGGSLRRRLRLEQAIPRLATCLLPSPV